MNKELTPKEQKFAELCVSLGNQTDNIIQKEIK